MQKQQQGKSKSQVCKTSAASESKTGKTPAKTKQETSGTFASKLTSQFIAIMQCCGIDVSKDTLEVCFRVRDASNTMKILGTRTFSNNATGIKHLSAYILKKSIGELPLSIVMEATGCYHELAAHLLHRHGFAVSVVLPNISQNYAKSLNKKVKTDKVDAQLLAQMGLERNLRKWKPASPNIMKIRKLGRERTSLRREVTLHKNQVHAEKHSFDPCKETLKRHAASIKHFEKQIDQINREIAALMKSDKELSEAVSRITTVVGLGAQTVLTVIAETNGFELVENKSQLVSYAGLDIEQAQSGTSIQTKGRISKKGNSHIRSCLYMPSMSAMRNNKELREVYDRVLEKHPKMGKKALVAVMRKLLVLIYVLYKNKTEYDPTYQTKKQAEMEANRAAKAA